MPYPDPFCVSIAKHLTTTTAIITTTKNNHHHCHYYSFRIDFLPGVKAIIRLVVISEGTQRMDEVHRARALKREADSRAKQFTVSVSSRSYVLNPGALE